jgi:nicotinate dehydrogenase subunit B
MNAPVDLSLSRREFLKASGALIISSSGAVMMAESLAQGAAAGKPPLLPVEMDSWIAILPNGNVTAFFGKMDMGHGIEVAIAQIVAEELDVSFERVQVEMCNTFTSCNQGGASGSTGIQQGGRPLRNAAAEARRLLVERAAQQWGVAADQCNVYDGVVFGPEGRKTSYAELIGGRYFNSKVEWNKQTGNAMDVVGKAKPKAPSQYKVVGKEFPRRDVAGKVFGTTDWVTDVSIPGMLHGRSIRPPHATARPLKVDEASIRSVRGAKVIREKNFIGVVAPREWDAVRAARMLKISWSAPTNPFPPMEKLHDHIRSAPVEKSEEAAVKGNVAAAFKTAARIVEAEYEWPFQSHASMGPGCALVDARADRATVWTGSQKPHFVRDGVAALLKLPQDKVQAIWVHGPGAYGRNDAGDAAIDAALLSKRVGAPVRVQGMRNDGTAWDPKGPACVHRARAALDASGKVIAYEFVSKGFSRNHIATNESNPIDSLAGQEMGLQAKNVPAFGFPAESYAFDNKRLAWESIAPFVDNCSPLRTSHLRDPVGPEIQFGSEQFIDELAAAAGEDPVAFRLKYVTAPRDAAVIRAAAQKANWQARPGPKGPKSGDIMTGRGIAYAQRSGTLVAIVAEVEVERKTGRIWAKKFTVAHDCGLIINPDGLRYTIEGNVVQGMSRTLLEEVRFDRNMVTSTDWNSYPILDMRDAPQTIEFALINRPEVAPSGAGEPTMRCIPAAIANAFFDATGVRIRRVPLTRERVMAALAKA